MQGKDTTKSTFSQLLIAVNQQRDFLRQQGVDKYVKKLQTHKLLKLLILAQLNQHKGLREISISLNSNELSNSLNLVSISHSQISRRLQNLPPDVIGSLYRNIVITTATKLGFSKAVSGLGPLHIIDSSTISLTLSRFLWAEFRKTKAGVKLHQRIVLVEDNVVPDMAVITPAKPADKTQMEALVTEKDVIYVFDRGYFDFKKFAHYCKESISFVTRIKSNTVVEVVKDLPVTEGSNILRDQIVVLGKGPKKMEQYLRLVEVKDTQGNTVQIVTNLFDADVVEVSEIYRRRWKIELFFKWLKQHMKIEHFYGQSSAAVQNQIYIALITYCLLRILQAVAGYTGSLLELKRMLGTCMFDPFRSLVKKLHKRPRGNSRGRRQNDHEQNFQDVLKLVEAGKGEQLDLRTPEWL